VTTPASAIQVVDDTLSALAEAGIDDVGMTPRPDVTVGPLDREAEGPRLNWFLYGIEPNAAFRNMEHPRSGSSTARGAPPLALELHYLLTAFAAEPTATGDQDQVAHVALAAAMRAIHENAIVGPGSPFLPVLDPPLLEPLRVVMESLDLEDLSKLWTAATKPMRLSVGYCVSLVVVEQQRRHLAGPPVREPRVLVVPSVGPRLVAVVPARVGGDAETVLAATGLVAATVFRLVAEPGDPTPLPTGGWPMPVVRREPGGVVLRLPRHDLVAGVRRLDAVTALEGLPASSDSIALTVVPTPIAATPSPVTVGATLTLTTAHTGPDTEVFVDGTAVVPTSVAPTQVVCAVPAVDPGVRAVSLRSGGVAGPSLLVTVTP